MKSLFIILSIALFLLLFSVIIEFYSKELHILGFSQALLYELTNFSRLISAALLGYVVVKSLYINRK